MASNPPHRTRAARPIAQLAALGISVLAAGFSLPGALEIWRMSPDSTGYLATAHSFVHGAGFVTPFWWNYYLGLPPPLPATAVYAPVVPLLAAIPLGLGATLSTVQGLHALWSSAIAGLFVLATRRFMRLGAALGAAVLLALSPAWIDLSQAVLTETTSVAALLLVLVTSRGVVRSVPGALFCALATIFAWLTRANLGVLVLPVCAGAILELGVRRAARHVPLWAYVLGFGALWALARWVTWTSIGLDLYAGYGVMNEIFSFRQGHDYQRQYVGAVSFIQANWESILGVALTRVQQLSRSLLFDRRFHWVGWIALPGILYVLAAKRPQLELRVCALAAIVFGAINIGTYSAFDSARYPLHVVVTGTLCGSAALDRALRVLVRCWTHPTLRRALGFADAAPWLLPLLVVTLSTAPQHLEMARSSWTSFASRGPMEFGGMLDRATQELCPRLDRDSLVAARDPKSYTLWCGNAAIMLPRDISRPEWTRRFIHEMGPRYLISEDIPGARWMEESPLLRAIAESGPLQLYEVRDLRSAIRPWEAPPPLACAGKGPTCGKR